jgi:N6-adenosine-specific RNA methylase IME4
MTGAWSFLLPRPGDDGPLPPAALAALASYEAACWRSPPRCRSTSPRISATRSTPCGSTRARPAIVTWRCRRPSCGCRAERRLGVLIAAQRATVGLNRGRAGAGRPKLGCPDDGPPKTDDRPTLAAAGIDRNLSSRSQRLASLADDNFEARLAIWRSSQQRSVGAVSVGLVRGGDKSLARASREEILGHRIRALPDKRFGVIYADPEWRFEVRSRETGLDRAADNHYPTSPTDVIAARRVIDIAAPICVLGCWATAPMFPHALRVIEAWGFTYKTHAVWVKVRLGKRRGGGYWFTGEHEPFIIATRGAVIAPLPGRQWPSVIEAPVGEHSEKPTVFLEMLEQFYPTLPRIELNARAARPGWDAWGLEAPVFEEGDA